MAVSGGLIAASSLHIKPRSQSESVPRHVHLANSLFYLALAVNLTCVGAAGLLKQWSHTYMIRRTSRQSANIHNRACIHAFFTKGARDFRVDLVAETLLPALQHLTIFLLLLGLLLLLVNTTETGFTTTAGWIGTAIVLYSCMNA
jgi:hypothetical protein